MGNHNKQYGFFGWKEFKENRNELLSEYDKSKGKNSSRPVQTAHGNAGEAAIRTLLGGFLPAKYGVTSGYIIPEAFVKDYRLYHYDVIIFDKLNSPILWIDGDNDTSEQGKKRAIPAKYIYSVIEVKATFNDDSTKEAIKKLAELNWMSSQFPENFITATIFFELKEKEVNNTKTLLNLVPDSLPHKYHGGIILRCDLNTEMTGLLGITNSDSESMLDIPLAKNIDDVKVYKDEHGQLTLGERGASATIFDGPGPNGPMYYVSKQYMLNVVNGG